MRLSKLNKHPENRTRYSDIISIHGWMSEQLVPNLAGKAASTCSMLAVSALQASRRINRLLEYAVASDLASCASALPGQSLSARKRRLATTDGEPSGLRASTLDARLPLEERGASEPRAACQEHNPDNPARCVSGPGDLSAEHLAPLPQLQAVEGYLLRQGRGIKVVRRARRLLGAVGHDKVKLLRPHAIATAAGP